MSRQAWMKPSAIWSLPAKTAVKSRNAQQLEAGVVAEVRRPVAEDRRPHPEVGLVHLVEVALHPRLGLDPVLRAGDVQDLGVAEVDQVPHREARAIDLVDRERVPLVAARSTRG